MANNNHETLDINDHEDVPITANMDFNSEESRVAKVASKIHEELMKSQDHVVWELNGGFVDEELTKEPCENFWEFLNSKTSNIIVVCFTVLQGFVILAALLIDLRIIQDPSWPHTCNNPGANGSNVLPGLDTSDFLGGPVSSPLPPISPNLKVARKVFSYTTLAILSFFMFETLLRIVTGRIRFFKQCIELFDALVVFAAFALGLAFLSAPKDGRDAAIFLVLLRLWRTKRVIQSVVQSTKRQMSHILNAYKRDKIQAEHKVELLILKVEDLEHEVAYLKEKLKKAEREGGHKRKKTKDSSSSSSLHLLTELQRHSHNALPLQRPPPEGRTESPPHHQDVAELYRFAETTVKDIMRTASNELSSREKWQKRRPEGSTGGGKDGIMLDPSQFLLQPLTPGTRQRSSDRFGSVKSGATSTSEELDELSEIERVKNVQFDPLQKQKDIPVTAL